VQDNFLYCGTVVLLMPPQKPAKQPSGPLAGLYTGMKREKRKPGEEKPKEDLFLKYTAWAAKTFKGLGRGAKYSEEQASVMDFVGYRVTPEDFRAAEMGALFIGIVIWLLVIVATYVAVGLFLLKTPSLVPEDVLASILFLGGAAAGLIAPLALFMLYQLYPSMQANKEKMLAIGYMPEIINYLIMSMRLSPNLEKAVEFAANHGRGKIAEDLKKVVWDVQIGKYLSVEEALDDLAYKWGAYNDDFKQALMIIRASVLEADQPRREALLEKAIDGVLEGSKEKMDLFARQLHAPTVYLYYFGVLLPLMLAIVLPIGSSLMPGLPFARPEFLFLIYVVGLPIGIFVLGSMILGGRPPTYEPPEIPEDFPGLPPKGTMRLGGMNVPYLPLAIVVAVALLLGGYFADQIVTIQGLTIPDIGIGLGEIAVSEGIPPYQWAETLPKMPQIMLPYVDVPYNYFGMLSSFGLLIGIAVGTSVYLFGKYGARKKVQDEIRSMETEFKDATYILASRLGENRPIEDAMKHAVEFLPKSKLANQVFRRVLDNITSMGMTLDEAIFNPTFGAIKDLPSKTIRSGMSILVDSVGLGVNVAAKSLIGLSMQLRNAEKIDLMLRRLLEDVTSMLKTMGTFIAPIVLGVVTSLQGVIVGAIAGQDCPEQPEFEAQMPGAGFFSGATKIGNMFCKQKGAVTTDPLQFTFIMGIYVVEVVTLLTYFNAQVEDSGNKLHTYMSIATALPLATALFCIVAYFAGATLATAGTAGG